ncbi:MAG TPA: hypothetical protein VNL94_02895 [Candidatus Binatia bacterium]|nr:hypothetical protein [Candidatus Binatia bacterium]
MDTRRVDERRDGDPEPADVRPTADAAFVARGRIDRSPSARRAQLVAIGTVIAIGGAILVASGNPGRTPNASPGPGATVPVAVATPAPSRAPWTWDPIELRGYGRGATVEGLWVVGDRFAAEVETDDGPDGGPYGPVASALLTSTDGRNWEQFELPVPGFLVEAGVVVDGRLVVYGHDGTPEARWQAWSTVDGEWRREPDPVGLAIGPARVEALAWGGCHGDAPCAGYVAGVTEDVSSAFEELRISEDGISWWVPEVEDIGPYSVRGVVWQGGRWHALVVQRSTPPGSTITGVLTSTDLQTWEWAEIAALAGGGRGIAASEDRVVIVGAEEMRGVRSPRAWLWDGTTWELVAPDVLPGRQPTGAELVLSTEPGFVSLSAFNGDAWLAIPGLGWQGRVVIEATPGDAVRTLVTNGEVIVAGGRSAAGRPTFWTGDLDALFEGLPRDAAAGTQM